jgi:hypothetical protein
MAIKPNKIATRRGEKVLKPTYMTSGYNTAPHTSVREASFLSLKAVLLAITQRELPSKGARTSASRYEYPPIDVHRRVEDFKPNDCSGLN